MKNLEKQLVIATFVPPASDIEEISRERFWKNANEKKNYAIREELQQKFLEKYGTSVVGYLTGIEFSEGDFYDDLAYRLHLAGASQYAIKKAMEIKKESDKQGYLNYNSGIKSVKISGIGIGIDEHIPGYTIKEIAQLYPAERFSPDSEERHKYGSKKIIISAITKNRVSYAGFTNLEVLNLNRILISSKRVGGNTYRNVTQIPMEKIEEIIILKRKNEF